MAHQLRRIIAVNIKHPTSGTTTQRISELELRGGVLVVGDNGAGKTTFLRLLPLFYGAKPSQLLRGSGRDSMIRYTLPGATSAVCFEYEREGEGEQHVRCAIMHCRPDKDAPQFMLVDSPYQEWFFIDENQQYVAREDIKARMEARQIYVSPFLDLHGYRAVILNERLRTKEAVDYKRLAPRFSLGPKPLHHLDQLAAAMASESLSFRDLKSVVLAYISDEKEGAEGPSDVPLRLNKSDITSWLEAREHLGKVLSQTAASADLKSRIGTVRGLNLELSALHVAVKDALKTINASREAIAERQAKATEAFRLLQEKLSQDLATAKDGKNKARALLDELNEKLTPALEAEERFRKLDMEGMLALAGEKKATQSQRSAKLQELELNRAGHKSITERAQAAKEEANTRFNQQADGIRARERQHQEEKTNTLSALHAAEREALQGRQAPARMSEIQALKQQASQSLGKLQAQAENPVCTEATGKAAVAAEQALLQGRRALDAAIAAAEAFAAEEVVLRREAASDAQSNADLEAVLQRHKDRLDAIEAQLAPPKDSLLAFLRSADPDRWRAGASVLSRDLLARTDLSPRLAPADADGSGIPAPGGDVSLDALTLNVAGLETPDWVDMRQLREARVRQVDLIADAQQACVASLAKAKASAASHQKKTDEVARAQAKVSLHRSAVGAAVEECGRLDTLIQEEKSQYASGQRIKAAAVTAQIRELDEELAALEGALSQAIMAVAEDFRQKRDAVEKRFTKGLQAFVAEAEAAQAAHNSQLAMIDEAVARELAGMGVDPSTILRLEKELSALDDKLSRIEGEAPTVASWKDFEVKIRPLLIGWKNERSEYLADIDRFEKSINRANDEGVRLDQDRRLAQQSFEAEFDALKRREQKLGSLLALLQEFLDFVPDGTMPEWDPDQLEQEVETRRSQLVNELDQLLERSRAMRNSMISRAGPLQDWLLRKEAEIPDEQTLSRREFACRKAEVLCSWFDPEEHGPYVDALYKEMIGFGQQTAQFVRVLNGLDSRIKNFNNALDRALRTTETFARFSELTATVSSGVGGLKYMATLEQMKTMADDFSTGVLMRSSRNMPLPTAEQTQLMRAFRDSMETDMGLQVNLAGLVHLRCTLKENGQERIISSEQDLNAISSNGNTALIVYVFLMGFLDMVRGPESPVRFTWVADEVARFDGSNMAAFIRTLDKHKINLIGACPAYTPVLGMKFSRAAMFEPSGRISAIQTVLDEPLTTAETGHASI